MVLFPIVALGALLPRLAVELYVRSDLGLWPALGVSVICVAAAITVHVRVLLRRFRRRPGLIGVAILVVGYCVYVALSISGANAKTREIADEIQSLHPYLRLAIGAVLLADKGLLLTDVAREPDDYGAMGLATRASSMHYVQDDGYVHAVDLRTKGRTELRNGLTRLYFYALGLHTLRHVGTADHLHVALPLGGSR
jgi:hypothetical protein